MADTVVQTPFQWLQELERRARQRAKGLPREEKVQDEWRGIGFCLSETALVTPLTDIREILPCPNHLAKVPGAKTWVKGLANIRGLLLPVIDLQACLNGKAVTVENRTRMLVINQSNVYAGLIVDEVVGIKSFPVELLDEGTPCRDSWLAPFARGLFNHEDRLWTIFDIETLAESNVFLKAAL